MAAADVEQKAPPLTVDKHAAWVAKLDDEKDTFEYWVTEHIRVSGAYWGLSAMFLLAKEQMMDRDRIVTHITRCQHESGGFGGNIGHEPNLLSTLSAVQVLALFDALDKVDTDKVARWVAGLQQPDGSFFGDRWGEQDNRFVYSAVLCMRLLRKSDLMNEAAAVEHVLRSYNWDGGFGSRPDNESHAAYVFCCVGVLALTNSLGRIDRDETAWWLSERQDDRDGGLNGRPEKKSDVCYSWWVISSLAMLGRTEWIDKKKLISFILRCQDTDGGGLGDKPGNMADVFHTFFGIAGLSLLGYKEEGVEWTLRDIDAAYAMPAHVLRRLGIAPRD
eukprot:Hpha_TRINITY_DN19908_c0_g1::TRINITY_DN19908_c0_g1_i1::g.93519::m.93519/K05956/RABGGTB; geranylgeranyl transferase type-2 subunit beta